MQFRLCHAPRKSRRGNWRDFTEITPEDLLEHFWLESLIRRRINLHAAVGKSDNTASICGGSDEVVCHGKDSDIAFAL